MYDIFGISNLFIVSFFPQTLHCSNRQASMVCPFPKLQRGKFWKRKPFCKNYTILLFPRIWRNHSLGPCPISIWIVPRRMFLADPTWCWCGAWKNTVLVNGISSCPTQAQRLCLHRLVCFRMPCIIITDTFFVFSTLSFVSLCIRCAQLFDIAKSVGNVHFNHHSVHASRFVEVDVGRVAAWVGPSTCQLQESTSNVVVSHGFLGCINTYTIVCVCLLIPSNLWMRFCCP